MEKTPGTHHPDFRPTSRPKHPLKVRKTIPPTAAPVSARDLVRGISGLFSCVDPGKFENGIREYFGSEFVFLVSSGKAALVLILNGLSSLRARKKVLIPAYTCYSVPSAIVKSGLEIALCDVDPDTLDFDYPQLERLADDKTLCIVSTHLFGIPTDVDRTRRICKEKGIFLVEDAAQAMGVTHAGQKLGTIGDVGFFSLGRGKNITCGSGGIILIGSEEVAGAFRGPYNQLKTESLQVSAKTLLELSLMEVFMNPFLYWLPDGLPFLKIGETHFDSNFPMFRMNRVKYKLLQNWKKKLDIFNNIKLNASEEYKDTLNLNRKIKIYSSKIPYLRFPIYLRNEEVKKKICSEYSHIGISSMYPGSINTINELSEAVRNYNCPASAMIAKKLVTLPAHGFVDGDQRKKICSIISDALDDTYRNP
jgi:dTDP-4-amino-4,6-dideoxygalactose transaminase